MRASILARLVRAVRFPLTFLPPRARLPIAFGPLRGARWIVGSGDYTYLSGLYELSKQRAFQRLVAPGATVYDLGAHVGFYTLLASRLVGPAGAVVAFEPVPRNAAYLREHVRLNHADNVMVIEAAVADTDGSARMAAGASSYEGRLSDGGKTPVRTVRLDTLVMAGSVPPPDVMKIDIEGSEMCALEGARDLLQRFHPALLLATHGKSVHRECLVLLGRLGYVVSPLVGRDVLKTAEVLAWYPDSSRPTSS